MSKRFLPKKASYLVRAKKPRVYVGEIDPGKQSYKQNLILLKTKISPKLFDGALLHFR